MTTDPNPSEPKATLLAVLAHLDDESFATGGTLAHWVKDSHAASLLTGAVRNDHV